MPSKLPRINVTVTDEQRALLFELARLQGGSAAGYLRQMLDASTPLLRTAVPLLRASAQEMELTKAQVSTLLDDYAVALKDVGLIDQLDLEDMLAAEPMAAVRNAASGSERGREQTAAPSRNAK